MNKSILSVVVSAAILAITQASLAGEVTGLTSFTANTPAVAAQVNANFTAVKTAVDNNHARVTTLEGNAASPNISITGNITLVPSTATSAGNIMKGPNRFLHNYGTNNTFLGLSAGNFNLSGTDNTASGAYTLQSNTTGYHNTASGTSALQNNTSGYSNTASGVLALQSNTTGSFNTASGHQALQNNTTGFYNTASGRNALLYNTTGYYNTASGQAALLHNTTGSNNTAYGTSALSYNTIGGHNIAIGFAAGMNLSTGDNNIAVGNVGGMGESDTIRIGFGQARAFIAGIRGVTTDVVNAIPVLIDSSGQLGTVSSSRRVKDDIADMGESSNVLKQLRPVTFHYKTDQNPNGRNLQYGLIAEEVEKVAPGLVARSANGEIETVYYQHLTPMLLNEYQKQQRLIEAQTAALAKQTERLAELEQERHLQTARIELLEKQAALMTMALGRMERAGLLTAAGRW